MYTHTCLQLRLVSLLPMKVSVVTCYGRIGYKLSLLLLCCKRCLRIARDSGTPTTNGSGGDIINPVAVQQCHSRPFALAHSFTQRIFLDKTIFWQLHWKQMNKTAKT